MENLDFFIDARIDYGGILQSVAQGFIVERDFAARIEREGADLVPIVDQLIIHGSWHPGWLAVPYQCACPSTVSMPKRSLAGRASVSGGGANARRPSIEA